MKLIKILILSVLSLSIVSADDNAQANNPLATMTAFNIQNYYIGDLTDTDEDANQAWLRVAHPVSIKDTNWLLRASLPLNSFPTTTKGDKETSIGDLNLWAAYLMDVGNPAISFGFGPQLTLPTAVEDELGSEKYSAGLMNVLFDATSSVFQYGYLLTWQHSFAGEDSRDVVNAAALQPVAFYQLGGGTYLRTAPIWTYNLENDTYNVPIGIGIGHVVRKNKTVYNFFIEPQFSAMNKGSFQNKRQIYMALNMQFSD